MFVEVEISAWEPVYDEPLGTKPKMWLLDPESNSEWLFKQCTVNRGSDLVEYRKGDDWAERIATAVAVNLGLPVAVAELATVDRGDDCDFGIISRKVLAENESLIHGNELLAEIGVRGDDPKDRTGYTLEAVRSSLEKVDPPIADSIFTAWEWFVGYLVLDALIANTDRHQENWAVIDDGKRRRLAPTFDHASSLGFQLSDLDRSNRLSTPDVNQQVPAWSSRARSRFEGSPHPCDIACKGLDMAGDAAQRHWRSAVVELAAIGSIVDEVPPGQMSTVARHFAVGVFEANWNRMVSQPLGTVNP